ncbi:MAG TPA: glycoside hydrolase family 3 N-terminal domain-containing protein, partial [Balneolaceae bacterium]|nr:glycoside hydrolase family 3 N-terminal domain-containing protein [Balneolaceae bacterium]
MKHLNRWLTLIFLSILASTSPAWAQRTSQLTEAEINQKVDSVMQTMTLTDKVGEMTQLTIDTISKDGTKQHQIDEDKLRKVLLDLRVGSILNVSGHAYTRDHWHNIIRKIQDVAVNEKPTHIPVLYGIDSIHGAGYVMGSTLFPQQIGMAATWNPDLVKQGAQISAY